ncbi:HRH3 protein, partial [Trogon melanurus]|nr:HRH3 protein [Trogon melanurus]
FSKKMLVLLAVQKKLLALVTIKKNVLVILAKKMDRNLRHRSNYYFLNLAKKDFSVGKGVCKLWKKMDYLLCTEKKFNIVLIRKKRFLSVTKKKSILAQQGITSNPVINMVAIWVFAFLLYGPAILFWEHVAGHSVVEKNQCHAEFLKKWHFLLCASTLEFFVPLQKKTYFNGHIKKDIQRRQR